MSTPEAGDRANAMPEEPEEDRPLDENQPAAEDQPSDPAEKRRERSQRQPLAGRVGALPQNAAARAGRLPLRWRITSMAVLGVLAAGAVASAALLGVAAHHDDVNARAGTAAREAATVEIPQILSYDYRTINADLARAGSDTTGEFRQQFGTLATQLIAPAAAQQQTVTKTTVPNASVVSATADQVVVLLFVDQITTNKTQRQPQQVASQIRVTMQQSGGRWLVAQFQAL